MEHQSPAPTRLRELATTLNLDADTLAQALVFFAEFEGFKPAEAARTEVFVRCAILLASKTTKIESLSGEQVPASYVSVTQLVRSLSKTSVSSFIFDLLTFTDTVAAPATAKQEIQALKEQYAFSNKFYEKFQEIWSALHLADRADRSDVVQRTQELTWLLFLVAKQRLLGDTCDPIETLSLLIAVVEQVSRLFPASVTTILTGMEVGKPLEFLCSLVKAKPAIVSKAKPRVEVLLLDLHKEEVLRANSSESLNGIFASVHIPHNLQRLNQEYAEKLSLAGIDERDFISTCHKVGTPIKQAQMLTPFAKHGPATSRQASHRVIKWDEAEAQLSLDSNLKEFSARSLSQQALKSAVQTPLTLAMEMSNWLHDKVETMHMVGVLPASLSELLSKVQREEEVRTIIDSLGRSMAEKFKEVGIGAVTQKEASFIEQHFSTICGGLPILNQEYLFMNSKVDLILKLCGVVLERLLTDKPEIDITEATVRGLAACCAETAFFLHNITAMDFEGVLAVCDCSAVNVWSQLSFFVQVDPRMPYPLRQHLSRVEVKILSAIAWQSEETIPLLQSRKLGPFSQRVISQSANRVVNLGEMLSLPEEVKEAVWKTVKYVLGTCTDLLKDRHLDQLILCSVFATCRTVAPIRFNDLNEQYAKLNPEEAHHLTHSVKMEDGGIGSIINFYNRVFLPRTKDFLTGQAFKPALTVDCLCPPSPLRENMQVSQTYFSVPRMLYSKSPVPSPFMTPRTKLLYAKAESPIKTAEPMRSQRQLVFGAENEKKVGTVPAHLVNILNPGDKLLFSLPQIKDGKKL